MIITQLINIYKNIVETQKRTYYTIYQISVNFILLFFKVLEIS